MPEISANMPIIKKRGRPKKLTQLTPSIPLKKRGRPKKEEQLLLEIEITEPKTSKRGRPRKEKELNPLDEAYVSPKEYYKEYYIPEPPINPIDYFVGKTTIVGQSKNDIEKDFDKILDSIKKVERNIFDMNQCNIIFNKEYNERLDKLQRKYGFLVFLYFLLGIIIGICLIFSLA